MKFRTVRIFPTAERNLVSGRVHVPKRYILSPSRLSAHFRWCGGGQLGISFILCCHSFATQPLASQTKAFYLQGLSQTALCHWQWWPQ
jgi:hypothetical protein